MTGLLRIDDVELVPMDGPPAQPLGHVRRGSIRIRGDRIEALGALAPVPGETVLNGQGRTALPGFVQGHVHLCQTLCRGLGDDLPLLEWLRARIWPMEAAHDAASVRASAELALLELVRGGTTTVQAMETVRHTEAVFAAVLASGITAVVGNCLMDRAGDGVPPALATGTAEALAIADDLRRAFDGKDRRVFFAVSPRFLLACSDELALAAAQLARTHDLRVHTHAAEHQAEVAAVRARTGTDYVEALHGQGLLGPRTGLAHCVHTSDRERALLASTGTAVLHCPSANQKLGSGIAPVADYRRRGIRVALGADGAACNNRLSALTELRSAALLQAMVAGPGAFPAAQALRTLTLGGAEALGLAHEVGSLAPGKRADLVLLALDDYLLEPGGDLASRIVYAATESHVRDVFVGGEPMVRDGQHVRLDPSAIGASARVQRTRLLARAGLSS